MHLLIESHTFCSCIISVCLMSRLRSRLENFQPADTRKFYHPKIKSQYPFPLKTLDFTQILPFSALYTKNLCKTPHFTDKIPESLCFRRFMLLTQKMDTTHWGLYPFCSFSIHHLIPFRLRRYKCHQPDNPAHLRSVLFPVRCCGNGSCRYQRESAYR